MERGRIQGLTNFFWVPPIISGMDKATNFKLGRYIHRVHANKGPLKFSEKMERGRVQGLPKFFEVPRIISGTGKVTNFKLGRYIHRVYANKIPLKIWENRERERIQRLPKFLKYPLLSQECVKLRTSNLANIFRGSMRTKAIKNVGENGAWAYTGTDQIFLSTPYYLRNG